MEEIGPDQRHLCVVHFTMWRHLGCSLPSPIAPCLG